MWWSVMIQPDDGMVAVAGRVVVMIMMIGSRVLGTVSLPVVLPINS